MRLTKLVIVVAIMVALSDLASAQKKTYGVTIIPKDKDSLATQQRLATIKALDISVFEAASFTGNNTVPIKYRLLRPAPQKREKKYPLVIVFHGSGAIGEDNSKQMGVLARFWAQPEIVAKYQAYVVVPQFPSRSSNYEMDAERKVLKSVPQPGLRSTLQLIDSLKKVLPVDEQRIYAVGFSMGGSSVINVLSARPELFAAGISISGIPEFERVEKLRTIPIWLMHGNKDTENPFDSDNQFYKEVMPKGKTSYWIFDGIEHNTIFSSAILGNQIPEWLFSKKK